MESAGVTSASAPEARTRRGPYRSSSGKRSDIEGREWQRNIHAAHQHGQAREAVKPVEEHEVDVQHHRRDQKDHAVSSLHRPEQPREGDRRDEMVLMHARTKEEISEVPVT